MRQLPEICSQDSCPVPPPAETTSQLPLFGYTVYVVLRVSKLVLPGPLLLGLNRQHLVLMDPSSQVGSIPVLVLAGTPRSLLSYHPLLPSLLPPPQKLCCSITLKDLQRLHLLSPLEEDGTPGLELNYGSADNPQTIWLELPQVRVKASMVPRKEACLLSHLADRDPGHWSLFRSSVGRGGEEGMAALNCLCPAGPGVTAHHCLPAGGQRVHSLARPPLRRVEIRQRPLTGQPCVGLSDWSCFEPTCSITHVGDLAQGLTSQ